MNKKDPNYLATLEKAISELSGEDTLRPINWTEEQEKEYIAQLKTLSDKEDTEKEEVIEKDGYSIEKKLFIKGNSKVCPKCGVYTRYIEDDLYIIKYKLCHRCYLVYEEGPKKETVHETHKK